MTENRRVVTSGVSTVISEMDIKFESNDGNSTGLTCADPVERGKCDTATQMQHWRQLTSKALHNRGPTYRYTTLALNAEMAIESAWV